MIKIKKQKVEPILMETYLRVIYNSTGSKIFKNLYAKVNGKKTDITQNGHLSCAFYVSSILFLFKLIREIHATVDGTAKDLRKSGWKEIKKPKLGSVLVWKEQRNIDDNKPHKHIGFYIGKAKAISNNSKYGYPTEHNWKIRKI